MESTRRTNLAAWKRQRSATLASSRASLKVQLLNDAAVVLLVDGGSTQATQSALSTQAKQSTESTQSAQSTQPPQPTQPTLSARGDVDTSVSVGASTKLTQSAKGEEDKDGGSTLESTIVKAAVTNASGEQSNAKNIKNNNIHVTTPPPKSNTTSNTTSNTRTTSGASNLNTTVDDLLANLGVAAAQVVHQHKSSIHVLQPPGGSSESMSLALMSSTKKMNNKNSTTTSTSDRSTIHVLQPPGGKDGGMAAVMGGKGSRYGGSSTKIANSRGSAASNVVVGEVVDVEDVEGDRNENGKEEDQYVLSIPQRLFDHKEGDGDGEGEGEEKATDVDTVQLANTTTTAATASTTLFSPRPQRTVMTSPIKPTHLWSHPTPQSNNNNNDNNDNNDNKSNSGEQQTSNNLQPEQIVSNVQKNPTLLPEHHQHHQDKLAPLDAIVTSCVVEPLRFQVQIIDSAMLLLFKSISRMNIMSTIEQLKRYMFMSSGYMFHEITAALWSGMLSAESADALGHIEKAQWTRSR